MAGGSYDRSNNNSRLNPAVAYAFALQVEAAFFLPLRAVRVFSKENEFDYYQEGGLNDYVHMLRKPITRPFTFQIERYVGVDSGFLDMNSGFLDPLALGTDLVLPLVLYVNRSPTKDWYKNITLSNLNCARAYVFTGCTVIAKEYGELNAEQSKLHTETITIAYRELFAMNQLDPGNEPGGKWEYDGTVAGSGTSHKENRNANLKADVSKWNYPGTTEKTTSVDHPSNRSRNEKVMPSKWNFPGSEEGTTSVDHTANRSVNQVKEPSKWNYPGTSEGTASEEHTTNRNINTKKTPSKWEYPKTAGEVSSAEHTANRSTNTKKTPSKWNYPGTSEGTASDEHTANRSTNTVKAPSKWNYPGTTEGTTSEEHTANRSTNTVNPPSKWNYPGSRDGGESVDHPLNRSENTKAAPVKWPPDRRALMAQALSDL